MPGKKKSADTEKISDRVEMKTLEKEVLDEEFRKGARLGFIIGAVIFGLFASRGFSEK
jgi:hypothetical protein